MKTLYGIVIISMALYLNHMIDTYDYLTYGIIGIAVFILVTILLYYCQPKEKLFVFISNPTITNKLVYDILALIISCHLFIMFSISDAYTDICFKEVIFSLFFLYRSTEIFYNKIEQKPKPNICKYCGAETTQPDNECYANNPPPQETL